MQKSSFFNSVSGDRKYLVSDFAAYFGSLLTNGVFPNPGTNLQVVSNGNMTATVSIGKGWISGYFYLNDSVLILPIEVADGTLKRIDRIVIRMDTVNRSIVAVVKKGVFASTPIALALQRDADAYELALADVYVGAGVTSINGAAITDQRMNTGLCGWVNSLIQADTTAIFNQYQAWFTSTTAAEQADFTAWFDSIKGQLSGDVATNLANQITAINGTGGNVEKANQATVVSHLADYVRQPAYAATTGSANTYAVSTTPAPTALVDGMSIYLDINAANTGASTLNWNGLGAIPIVDSKGAALVSGKLKLNCIVGVRYNASNANFQLLGEGGDTLTGTLTTADVLSGKTGYSTDPESKIIGTMPEQGSPTLQPGAAIAAGHYSGGSVAAVPHGSQSYTTPGTYSFTVPANVNTLTLLIGGAGGAGSRNNSYYGSGGGAGGSYITTISVIPLSVLSVVVGRGGGENYTNNSSGETGGNSSVGSYIAYGGVGGVSGSAYCDGGAGGAGGGYGGAGGAGSKNAKTWAAGTGGGSGVGGHGGAGSSTSSIGFAGDNGKVIILW